MERLQRVRVWSGWLRLSHALIGLSTLALLVTGWLLDAAPSLREGARDIHYLLAAVLVFGLALRLLLMFRGSPVERIDQLAPGDDEWSAVKETARFYLSLGKTPLPRWYAHNPLWKSLYLLLYVLLLVLVLSGWLRDGHPLLLGIYLPDVHALFATVVACWSVLHVLAVILHDYRGDAADTSSIINGHRLFLIEKPGLDPVELQETAVRLDQIGRTGK